MIEFGHLSHPGTLGNCNESTYYANAQLGFWTILDGLGGRGCGDIASSVARDAVVKSIRLGHNAVTSIRDADQALRATPRAKASLRGTGIAALHLAKDQQTVNLSWVGSCHALELDPRGECVELTTATDPESPTAPRTMALGITDANRLQVSTRTIPLEGSKRLLLCSDGILPLLGTTRIAEILADPECSAQEMVDTIAFEAIDQRIEESFSLIALKI